MSEIPKSASTVPGPQGTRVEPVPAPVSPVATPEPINIRDEYRKIEEEFRYDPTGRRDAIQALTNRLRVEEGIEPQVADEPLPPELQHAMDRYAPDVREQIGAHLKTLLPLTDEVGVDHDSFSRLASFAMQTAQMVRMEDRFDTTAEGATEKCAAYLGKVWGAQYEENLRIVRETVTALGPKFSEFLDQSTYGNDPSVLQAILLHGHSRIPAEHAETSSGSALFKQTKPTPVVPAARWGREGAVADDASKVEAQKKIDAWLAKGGKLRGR